MVKVKDADVGRHCEFNLPTYGTIKGMGRGWVLIRYETKSFIGETEITEPQEKWVKLDDIREIY